MENYHEIVEEIEGFMLNRIESHLNSVEERFSEIGLGDSFVTYSEKLRNPTFEETLNSVTGDLICAVVDGSTVLSVKTQKSHLDEFIIYENNL